MDFGRLPTVELRTAVKQHLHQAHHPGVVNLAAGDLGSAGRDRYRERVLRRRRPPSLRGRRHLRGSERLGEARPGFVFSLAVPCSDTTAKRAFQVSQSPAGQRLFEIGRSQQPGLWLSPLFMGCWVLQQKLGQRIPPLLEASIRLR